MVGSALKKYAKENGLKNNGGVVYGELGGYSVSMCDGAGIKQLTVLTRFPDAEKKHEFENVLNAANLSADYRVQSYLSTDDRLDFIFTDKIGTMTVIGNFIQWLLPVLTQYGAAGADICTKCGYPMNGQGKWVLIDGTAVHMHEGCVRGLSEQIHREEETVRREAGGSYLSGTVGALLGGLLGAAAWGLVMLAGYIAGIVGFLIGFLAEKGYALLKGKLGKGKVAILIVVIVLCVIVGTLFGEYLFARQAIKEFIAEYGSTDITPMELLIETASMDPEVRKEMISNIALGLLFAGLSVIGLIRRAHAEVSDTKIKELK